MWKWFMGLAHKGGNTTEDVREKFKNPVLLDDREIDFILEKLQTAQYIGREFEMFYNVWIKLSNMKKDGE
jgi:hypothetical protein